MVLEHCCKYNWLKNYEQIDVVLLYYTNAILDLIIACMLYIFCALFTGSEDGGPSPTPNLKLPSPHLLTCSTTYVLFMCKDSNHYNRLYNNAFHNS